MELIAIGVVRTSWGVKGWLKLSSFSGEWDHFMNLETVVLKGLGRGRDESFDVEAFRPHQDGLLMKLAGIDSPEAGKLLAGREILVSAEHSAPLNDDEYYLRDLVGLRLTGKDGDYGTITGVIESSDDLLEVERPDGSRFLIPFRSEFVSEPDLKAGTLVLTADWLAENP